jgi:hypothetical protein
VSHYPSGDPRGSAEDRRRRRQWLLDTFGNGVRALCRLRLDPACLGVVDLETMSVDRIRPGLHGGTYRRGNIQPACQPCQTRQGLMLRGMASLPATQVDIT